MVSPSISENVGKATANIPCLNHHWSDSYSPYFPIHFQTRCRRCSSFHPWNLYNEPDMFKTIVGNFAMFEINYGTFFGAAWAAQKTCAGRKLIEWPDGPWLGDPISTGQWGKANHELANNTKNKPPNILVYHWITVINDIQLGLLGWIHDLLQGRGVWSYPPLKWTCRVAIHRCHEDECL